MYIPKWVPISQAIYHVRAVQGLNAPDAEHLLVLALRDEDVKARNADTGTPVQPQRWRATARHPVHMPGLYPVEIFVEDLLRHWPERSPQPRRVREGTMDRNPIPAIIPATTALSETVGFLQRADSLHRANVDRTLREELYYAESLTLTDRAVECLRTACAAANLKMVVVNPEGGQREEVLADYFDRRPFADLEFASAFFHGCKKSELVAVDPLFKLVRRFSGWVHGLSKPIFDNG